jgi:hypothetical protein
MVLPSFPNVDLFSAGVNALNGAVVAQNRSHNRGYTAAGILIMGFLGISQVVLSAVVRDSGLA